MNAAPHRTTDLPLSAYVGRAVALSLAALWVFRPEPLWHEVDIVPHWVYGVAFWALFGVCALVQYVRKRLHPVAEPPIEPDLEKYSMANQPTDAAAIAAIVAPFGWMFIDHVVVPGLQRIMPAVVERAIYLVIVVSATYVSAKISNWRSGNGLSLADPSPPSS